MLYGTRCRFIVLFPEFEAGIDSMIIAILYALSLHEALAVTFSRLLRLLVRSCLKLSSGESVADIRRLVPKLASVADISCEDQAERRNLPG